MVPPLSPASTEPLMVPDPAVRPQSDPIEPESPGSTTISQFELASDPTPRLSRMNRPSLSVIAELVGDNNTPADRAGSISVESTSRTPSSASVLRGQSPVLAPVSSQPFQITVTDASPAPDQTRYFYVYRRPSFVSSSSRSAGSADRTSVGSTRCLNLSHCLRCTPPNTA